MSSAENFFDKTIRYLFYSLFFLTPLVMWVKTSEVFEFNKMLFVYLITILVSATWIIKSLKLKKFSLAKTSIDIPILIFVISQAISTLLSIDHHTSLWGYYSRFHGGFMSTISYIILFYAFITHSKQDKNLLRGSIVSIVSSAVVVSIYGVLEHFGIDKHVWVQDVQSRVFSTLGQPNWLSAYLLAVLPISIISAATEKVKSQKIIHWTISFLIFLTILYTKSRSGIGATLIIILIMLATSFYLSFKEKGSKFKKTLLLALPIFLVTIFLAGTPWTPTPQSLKQSIDTGGPLWPTAEKYLSKIGLTTQIKPVQVDLLSQTDKENYERSQQGLRVGGSDSMDIRKIVWQGAIELTKRYPFFGTGVDTFGYSYYWVRPSSHNLLSEWDFLYNRAHNEYLNMSATTGLVGFLSYLALIISFLFVLIKNTKNNPFGLALLLGFISILITNYFGFSVVCVAIFFFFFPAIAISQSSYFKISEKKLDINFGIGTFIVSSLTIYLILKLLNSWTADIAYAHGKTSLLYGPSYLNEALVSLEKAALTNRHEPLYLSQLSEAQAQIAMYINEELKTLSASVSAQEKLQYQSARDFYATSAMTNSQKAIDMNPYQTNYYKAKAKVGLYLATFDPNYYNEVISSLLKVSEKAPTDAKVLYNIGLVYLNTNRLEEAKNALKKATELKPDYYEAVNRLEQLNATPEGTKK